MLIAVFSFIRYASPTSLAVSILALGGVILCFGLLLVVISVRATEAPIRSVQLGMAEVADGKLDAEVIVYDGTELGELQTGFNRMAEGLREREKIRDLFGRHVGQEVASNALRHRPELGGEERDVSVLFVDIIGSTTLTATRSPRRLSTYSTDSSMSWSTRWIADAGSSTNSKVMPRWPSSVHRSRSTIMRVQHCPPLGLCANGSQPRSANARRVSELRPGARSRATSEHTNDSSTR